MPATEFLGLSGICTVVGGFLLRRDQQVTAIMKSQDERITQLLEDYKELKKVSDDNSRKLSQADVLNARLEQKLKTCQSSNDYLKRERDEAVARLQKMKEGK